MNSNIGKNITLRVGIMKENPPDAEIADILSQYYKSKEDLQKKFVDEFGFALFKPLREDDAYKEKIEVPRTQPGFEIQILYLAISLQDSIDQASLKKKLDVKPKSGSLNVLELFLTENELPLDIVSPLRDLQKIRSKSAAHRKGGDYKTTMNKIRKKYAVNRLECYSELFCKLLLNITKKFSEFDVQ